MSHSWQVVFSLSRGRSDVSSPSLGGGLPFGFACAFGLGCSGSVGSGGNSGNISTGGGGGFNNKGGSGIVVINHPTAHPEAITTGSPNVIYADSNIIYRFWQSGTIVWY